jgi:hypothetical protein
MAYLPVHRCLECKRTFADTEPGCWTGNRSDEFPELCSSYTCQRHKRTHGTGRRSAGPYCPACAPKVEARLLEIRQAYEGW